MTKEEQAELDNMAAVLPKAGDPVTQETPVATESVPAVETPASEATATETAQPEATEKVDPATEFAKSAEQISKDNAPVSDEKAVEDLAKALGVDPAKVDKAKVAELLTRKAQSMYTKSQQKTKSMLERKLEETINDLKGSDVFQDAHAIPHEEVKSASDDEIIKASGLEDNEDARRLLKVVRNTARAEAAPALNARAQLEAVQRQQVEIQHWESMKNATDDYPFTRNDVETAKSIQAQPQYRNFTIAQILQATKAQDIQRHMVKKEAANVARQMFEEMRKEAATPKEHPGGRPGAAQRKPTPAVDPSKMSDKEFFEWAENGGLPKADYHP